MSVTLHLMRTTSDEKTLFKNYTEYRTELSGFLRDGTSILNPVIAIDTRTYQLTDVAKWNYAYIADFHRYYFIDDVVSLRTDLWEFHLRIDVLGSWYKEIETLTALVARCEDPTYQNPYLIDDKIPTENNSIIYHEAFDMGGGFSAFDYNFNNHAHNIMLSCVSNQIPVYLGSGTRVSATSVTIPSPETLGGSAMITKYAITLENLNRFISYIQTSDFIDQIPALFNRPLDYIISIMAFPFDIKDLFLDGATPIPQDSAITIGDQLLLNRNIDGYAVTGKKQPLLKVGTTVIRSYNDNFLDFSPFTKIELYLPYVGFITLDNSEVVDKHIEVDYAIDFGTGACTAYIIHKYYDSLGVPQPQFDRLLSTHQGQIGMPIPINGVDGVEKLKTIMSLGTSAVTTAAGLIAAPFTGGLSLGAAVGGGVSLLNTVTSYKTPVVKGGAGGGATSFYTPLFPYVIYTTPNAYYTTEFDKLYGRPSMKDVLLSNLKNSGFVQVADIHIEGSAFQDCTMTERQEIERLLKEGVIFNDDTN